MPTTLRIKDADLLKFTYVKELILHDLSVHYTIPELSARSEMNEFKLKTGFKQLYGLSIYDFLQHHRMNLGLHLLTSTDDSIQSIAQRCGYGYSTNFIAVFRKYFHTKPSEYRRTAPSTRDYSNGAPYTSMVDNQVMTLYQFPGQPPVLHREPPVTQ